MIEKVILHAIIGIAISTVLALLVKATRKSVEPDANGKFILRMNKLYGIVGMLSMVFGILFLTFFPLTPEFNSGELFLTLVLMLLIFWGTGIPCLMYYQNHRVIFNEDSIMVSNYYGKIKEINWSNITDIKFKPFLGVLVLSTTDAQVKVHQHLVGLSKFIEYIENKTKWTRKELKIQIGKIK